MKLGTGPLSDKRMIAAVKEVVAVRIDIKEDPKNVAGKFTVIRVPTLIFTKWDGERIETYEGEKEALPMATRIREIGEKHKRDLPWEESLEKAQEKAKEGGLVAAVFLDKDEPVVQALLDESLKELVAKLRFVKFKAKGDDAKKFKVTRSATILLLDAEGKELGRAEGNKTRKELKSFLEKALKKDE